LLRQQISKTYDMFKGLAEHKTCLPGFTAAGTTLSATARALLAMDQAGRARLMIELPCSQNAPAAVT
jgi:hypothetical protein